MDHKQNLPQSSGVNINYHALLMENHIAESNLESSKGLKAVKTSEDFAALFFIDKKGSFKVVSHSADSDSAWMLNTLSPDGYEVTAFALYHDEPSNNLTLAYARRKNNVSELLVSKAFDLGTVDLNKWEVNFAWANKVLERKERIIDHITMDAQGVLFSTHFTNTDAAHHYFKYSEQPRSYTLPENGELPWAKLTINTECFCSITFKKTKPSCFNLWNPMNTAKYSSIASTPEPISTPSMYSTMPKATVWCTLLARAFSASLW